MNFEQQFAALAKLGAGDFDHIDGGLLEHLSGTRSLLQEWGASSDLQVAGLFHAAYGTAGFSAQMVGADQRQAIADIIGVNAEDIVYQYCACDREDFFKKIVGNKELLFVNRFNGNSYFLSDTMLKEFCELTAANEVEIGRDNSSFLDQYGAELNRLFKAMTPYLSEQARSATAAVFSEITAQ